ncbi:hypothetical protein BKA62DRAFT_702791 [Auriculariales sp. MPI-PUGE-AT-0066]|nr:hypothetical protein BKA62DRAFT_702791 [Auriculariales sp. MPI-PUGE-AT-0066]
MHVLILSASRHIGYFAALRLLAKGETVSLFVRSANRFDDDQAIQGHIRAGRARVVVGDGLNEEDVRRAVHSDSFDFILISIGATQIKMTFPHPTITPADICERSTKNVLAALRSSPHETSRATRVIAITSAGMGRQGFAALPLAWKPVYWWLLPKMHADKQNMERALGGAAGRTDWGEEAVVQASPAHEQAWLNAMIVRPAHLTDSESLADKQSGGKEAYRVGEYLRGIWSISRKDVAHFIVEEAIPNFAKYRNRAVDICY